MSSAANPVPATALSPEKRRQDLFAMLGPALAASFGVPYERWEMFDAFVAQASREGWSTEMMVHMADKTLTLSDEEWAGLLLGLRLFSGGRGR